MMRTVLLIVAAVTVLSCSTASGARVRIDEFPADVYGIYLDGEELNGQFDTIIADIRSDDGFSFANIDPGVVGRSPRPAGDQFTYISGFLSTPFGTGFSVLGPKTTASEISFTAGPLGRTIDTTTFPGTPETGVFLANVHMPNGTAVANMRLVRAGAVVADLTSAFGVPEPSTLGLAGFSLAGLAPVRRERRNAKASF